MADTLKLDPLLGPVMGEEMKRLGEEIRQDEQAAQVGR